MASTARVWTEHAAVWTSLTARHVASPRTRVVMWSAPRTVRSSSSVSFAFSSFSYPSAKLQSSIFNRGQADTRSVGVLQENAAMELASAIMAKPATTARLLRMNATPLPALRMGRAYRALAFATATTAVKPAPCHQPSAVLE